MKNKIVWLLFLAGLSFHCSQSNPFIQGERIYQAQCASCHMEKGQGLKSLYPPLAKSDYLVAHFHDLPCIITKGISHPIVVNGKTYELPMPPIKDMTPVEITNVINFIAHAWGNDLGYTKLEEVKRALENCSNTH
ncbi:MAG TPA: cytochrome c [Phaeodactylibacter sp.]|nr:cytochrome c [Phaeodactylibacter sp.]